MATALQTILLHDTGLDLPFTKLLTTDKHKARKEVKELMGYDTIEQAKTEITAIYQGRKFNDKKYKPLKHIFDERDKIAEIVITDKRDSKRVKYATLRTETKHNNLKVSDYHNEKILQRDRFNILKSYMFFYWTYKERQIQDIISKRFNRPITLHDAVYTQDKVEMDNLDIDSIKEEIHRDLGLKIDLEIQ